MTMREIVYPNYSAKVTDGGDIRIRFVIPRSKFGSVEVILVADDAVELLRQIDRAVDDSVAMLDNERESVSRPENER